MFGEWLPFIVIAGVFVVFTLLGGGPGGGWGPRCWSRPCAGS